MSAKKNSNIKQNSFCSVDSNQKEMKKITFSTHYTNRTQ